MKQINGVAHSADDIYPRACKEIVEIPALEYRNDQTKDTQIEKEVIPDMMLRFVKIKLTEYGHDTHQVPNCTPFGKEYRF
jgi:hypothetical protein